MVCNGFVHRVGGMHMLTRFCVSIGTLLQNSGISEILFSTFGGVGKMLTKEILVAEEILRNVFMTYDIHNIIVLPWKDYDNMDCSQTLD